MDWVCTYWIHCYSYIHTPMNTNEEVDVEHNEHVYSVQYTRLCVITTYTSGS